MKTITSILTISFFAIGSLISQNNLDVYGNSIVRDGEIQFYDNANTMRTSIENTANGMKLDCEPGLDLSIGLDASGLGDIYFNTQNGVRRFTLFESGRAKLSSNIAPPLGKLHIAKEGALSALYLDNDGTSDLQIRFNNTGGDHFIFDDESESHSLKIESANDLVFNTGGPNQRLRIDDGGLITIGNITYPSTTLALKSDNEARGIWIGQDYATAAIGLVVETLSQGIHWKTGIMGSIDGVNGNGISRAIHGYASTTPSNFYAMYSQGDIYYTGTLSGPSDIRLKKNIKDLDPVLDKVMQLQTKTYEFDRETYHYANLANGVQHGFIAQNVQELFPNLVEEERHSFTIEENPETGERIQQELDILGMSTIEMIPILTKAIQEQQELILQLQSSLSDYSSITADLIERIESIENE